MKSVGYHLVKAANLERNIFYVYVNGKLIKKAMVKEFKDNSDNLEKYFRMAELKLRQMADELDCAYWFTIEKVGKKIINLKLKFKISNLDRLMEKLPKSGKLYLTLLNKKEVKS